MVRSRSLSKFRVNINKHLTCSPGGCATGAGPCVPGGTENVPKITRGWADCGPQRPTLGPEGGCCWGGCVLARG